MPIASLSIALLSTPSLSNENMRLALIGGTCTLAILPLVWMIRETVNPVVGKIAHKHVQMTDPAIRMDFIWAWIARLLVQFSGAVMFGYLLYFLQDVAQYGVVFSGERVEQGMGKLTLAATPVTIFIGILAGVISDHTRLRRPFLLIAPIVIATTILLMSLSPSWPIIFICYMLFVSGITIFLTIDAALVAQLVSGDAARARKLGIMNLTNTIPAIFVPATALLLTSTSPEKDTLVYLMQISALLAIIATFAANRIRTIK